MDYSNNNKNSNKNNISSEEEIKDLLKSIAIHEAKSAIAKIKLAKFAVVKGADTIGKGAKKLSGLVEQKIIENKKK